MADITSLTNNLYGPLAKSLRNLSTSTQKLATGSNIPNAAEGLGKITIANTLRQRISANQTLMSSLENASGILSMQDSALQSATDIVNRMYTLASTALDPSKTATDLVAMNTELTSLKAQLGDIVTNANYNGTAIFSATTVTIAMQYGVNTSSDTINLGGVNLGAITTAITATSYAVDSVTAAANLISIINASATSGINVMLNSCIATVGVNMMKVARVQDTQAAYISGMQNAESAIRDVDIAQEAAKFTKNQLKVAIGQSILVQCNNMMNMTLKFFQ